MRGCGGGRNWFRRGGRPIRTLPAHLLPAPAALPSLVILPAPEEPPAHPAGSPSIRGLEPQSLCCLQPFHTQDTRGRLFHAQAQEALEVLLRHPSGGAQESRGSCFCRDASGLPDLRPHAPLAHRMVAGGERRLHT